MLKAMSIALLYERSENDENGIKLTAQQLGIDLTFSIVTFKGQCGFRCAGAVMVRFLLA